MSPIPTLTRNQYAAIASTLLLAAAMTIWSDLFAFSKAVHLPAWTKHLPNPINTPAYLAFVCLAPAALVPITPVSAGLAVIRCLLIAPLPALIGYALNPIYQDQYLFWNLIFNYLWMILFHCLIPALLLLSVRAVVHYLPKLIRG